MFTPPIPNKIDPVYGWIPFEDVADGSARCCFLSGGNSLHGYDAGEH